MHQRVSLDDAAIPGALVRQRTGGGWLARAGVRVRGEFATGLGILQPYARANLYRSTTGADTARFIGPAATTDIVSGGGHTSSELAAGFTLALTPATAIYGELGKLWAHGGDTRVGSSAQGGAGPARALVALEAQSCAARRTLIDACPKRGRRRPGRRIAAAGRAGAPSRAVKRWRCDPSRSGAAPSPSAATHAAAARCSRWAAPGP